MNDLTVLSDAFAELERRADEVTAAVTAPASEPAARPAGRERRHWPLVAAASAGVLVVAAGAALLAQSGGDSPGRPVAGGSSPVAKTSAKTSVSSPAAVRDRVPNSPEEIVRRFGAALDDGLGYSQCSESGGRTCSFSVTDTGHAVTLQVPDGPSPSSTVHAGSRSHGALVRLPNGSAANGAAIVGQLTVAGVTGGYDVQMFDTHGAKASCDAPAQCSTTVFADGTTLAVGQNALEGGGVTYVAEVVRSDGTAVLMHVSNQKDPKGDSAVLTAKPPLSRAQLRAVVTSNSW